MAIVFNNQNNSIGLGSISSGGFTTSIVVNSTGVGIGTTNAQAKLHVVGDVILDKVKITSTGIITSTNPGITTVVYYGDGSKLTGIDAVSATSVVLDEDTASTVTNIVFSQTPGQNPTSALKTNPGLIFNAANSSLGIGNSDPSFKLDVSGDTRVRSSGKMRFGGTAGASNFYIQYNSTTNSLDFVAG